MGIDPIARSGHLTDLGIEALALGTLSPSALRRVHRHARDCPLCQARLAELGLEVPDAPPRRWVAPVVTLGSLAAALALWVGRPADPSDFRPKGGEVLLEVWVHDGVEANLLGPEEAVGQGERLGFRLDLDESAYVMVVAVDEQHDRAVVFPRLGDAATWVEANEPGLLPVAVVLDDSEGAEWFHSVVCPDPFELDEALAVIETLVNRDCVVQSRQVRRAGEE
ncbi:MAG: hypothetical protein AAGA48_19040 [Myxococcota bacterium]